MVDALSFRKSIHMRQPVIGRAGNVVADHLSRLTIEERGDKDNREPILDQLPIERVMATNENEVWYADIANYLATGYIPDTLTKQERKKIRKDALRHSWNEPYLFREGSDGIFRRCVTREEGLEILTHCHDTPQGGH